MKKFLAVIGKRDYKDILLGNMVAPPEAESLDEITLEGKKKKLAIKANDNAYQDLILANEDPVSFKIVDKSVTTDLTEGYSIKSWLDLYKKYDKKTTKSLNTLISQFNDSKFT